ncbi:MAG: CHASE2 domain-containing protein, partial [Legionella sp.]
MQKHVQWLGVCLSLFCTLLVSLTLLTRVPLLSSFIEQMNFQIYDQIIRLNWHPYNHIPKVIIIDIDEESIHKEGRWPWRRDRMAELLNKLKQDGVVTIGLDIVMSEEEPNFAKGLQKKLNELPSIPDGADKKFIQTLNQIAPLVDSDQILAQKLSDHTVVLGFLFHNDVNVQKGQLPPPLTDPQGKKLDANAFTSLE